MNILLELKRIRLLLSLGINWRVWIVASYVGELGDGLCLEVGIISAKFQANVGDFFCDVSLFILLVLADAPDKVRQCMGEQTIHVGTSCVME